MEMKVEKIKTAFDPVVITLEDWTELASLINILGAFERGSEKNPLMKDVCIFSLELRRKLNG